MARKKISMSSFVRKALAKGITKPTDVVAHIQKEHGVTVKVGLVNNVKSTEAKKKPSKPGRKPSPEPTAAVASSNGRAASNGKTGTLTMQDITTVKGLLSRLGKSDLQELITVLA